MAADSHAVSALFDEVRRELPGAALDRLTRVLIGPPGVPIDPRQRPGFLFLPFLANLPWHHPPSE